jgi:hypothetical protein
VAAKLTGRLMPPARIGKKIPKSEKHFIEVVICFRWREASRVLKKGRPLLAALEFFMPTATVWCMRR